MKILHSVAVAVGRYVANEDPLAKATNKMALLLASDMPFFALYLLFLVGERGFPSVISTVWFLPIWLALPVLSRRNAFLSRVCVVVVAVLNCVSCSLIIGWDSGTALFLIPCIMLGSIAFHRHELKWQLILTGLPFLGYFLLHFVHIPPPVRYSAHEYYLLTVFNAFTVACLTASMGFLFAHARPTLQRGARSPDRDPAERMKVDADGR